MTLYARLEITVLLATVRLARRAVRHCRTCPITLCCPLCVLGSAYARWLRQCAPRWLDAWARRA